MELEDVLKLIIKYRYTPQPSTKINDNIFINICGYNRIIKISNNETELCATRDIQIFACQIRDNCESSKKFNCPSFEEFFSNIDNDTKILIEEKLIEIL
ncbi:MAG: hypothetical protein H7836_08105 [Magnetococcus sp. YQC-3]